MTNDIKEILDAFTKYKDNWYSVKYILKPKQCVMLLDYITNLQEGITHLDRVNCHLRKKITSLEQQVQDLKADYGSKSQVERDLLELRIDEAIEYINNCPEYLWANVNTKILLNILKGGSNE